MKPELNLHPQFQSFFIQEARKVAGAPQKGTRRKGIFLVTHSPFILDLRTVDEMRSVFCFSVAHDLPKCIGPLQDEQRNRFAAMIPRLNVHHKQLFFADHPIFVEGISDAQFIEAVQERRQASITAAGSCLIDVGGSDELTKYVELCRQFGKDAYFVFDLDSLFLGSLRQCIRADGTVASFLASVGVGADFSTYCGALDRELTDAVKAIEAAPKIQGVVASLQKFFATLPDNPKKLARQRVALLIELASNRKELAELLTEKMASSIEGRLRQVQVALQNKHIFLLGGGALEHYLPTYQGSRYIPDDNSKKAAVASEIDLLLSGRIDSKLEERYGDLPRCIASLPAKPPVDLDGVLFRYVSKYIHELQNLVVTKPEWGMNEILTHIKAIDLSLLKLIELADFKRLGPKEFKAVLRISGGDGRLIDVTHETNAGMHKFSFRAESAGTPVVREPRPAATFVQASVKN